VPGDSPQRVLYLHIGTQKTGTTTVQNMCKRNRDLLAGRGLYYPSAPGEGNHVGLMLYAVERGKNLSLRTMIGLRSPEEVEAFNATLMQRLQDEIAASGCSRVLLSNEHLSSHVTKAKDVRNLVADLRRICPEIRVVIYLRPQYELVLSAYSEAVKSGRAKPMNVELNEDTHFYNYDMMLSLWEMAVGIENIRVRLFHRDEFAEGSLITDFFRTIDMEVPESLELPGPLNRSFDAYTLEFARIANAVTPREDRGVGPWLLHLQNALERISSGPKFTAGGPELAELDRTFAASNAEVARRYFPERNGVLFAPFNELERPSSPPLTTRKVVELTIELWREATERKGPRRKQEQDEED
jgi:hypothetical protein